jgi:hypothetical protein
MRKTYGVAIPVYKAQETILPVLNSLKNSLYLRSVKLFVDDSYDYNYLKEIDFPFFIEISYNTNNLGYQKNWNLCLDWLKKFDWGIILHSDDQIKINIIEEKIINYKKNISLIAFSKWQTKEEKVFSNLYDFIDSTGLYLDCSSIIFNMKFIAMYNIKYKEDILACDEYLYIDIFKRSGTIRVLKGDVLERRKSIHQAEYNDILNNEQKVIYSINQQISNINNKRIQLLLKKKIFRTSVRGFFLKLIKQKKISTTYLTYILLNIYLILDFSLVKLILSDFKRALKLSNE